jgi:hypothetical protein
LNTFCLHKVDGRRCRIHFEEFRIARHFHVVLSPSRQALPSRHLIHFRDDVAHRMILAQVIQGVRFPGA